MNVLCSAKPCPVLLSTTCVFYEGEDLIYSGINTNDSVQVALQKLDAAIGQDVFTVNVTSPLTITAGPNPIIGITQASATVNGYLTSTDWNTFNSKQAQINGIGFVKASGTTISYDNSTYYLASNPNNYIPLTALSSASTELIYTNTTGVFSLASGYSIPTTASQATWDAAYNDKINSAAVTGTSTKTLTLNQQDGGTVTASWSDAGITSVGLTMPSAFSVANSPLTSNGILSVTGAGTASQYIRGDGALATYNPGSGGGGASQSFYLNGSISQAVSPYKQMSTVPVFGAGTNFSLTNTTGYIAQFLTDVAQPNQLLIPAGNWNFEIYFNVTNNNHNASFYVELYKYDGTTFTLISSSSANPEGITNGTTIDLYFTALSVPQTTLTLTDRLAVRVFVNTDGNRTVTMHTENSNLSQIITTFTTGITALNRLTAQVQNFATGTSGTDFNISSVTNTHTFNLPTASSSVRGLLSSSDWSSFNGKQNALGFTPVPTTRTLTINGTAFDLSADRSWTVSSVAGSNTQVQYNNAGVLGASALFTFASGNIGYGGNGTVQHYLFATSSSTPVTQIKSSSGSVIMSLTDGGFLGLGGNFSASSLLHLKSVAPTLTTEITGSASAGGINFINSSSSTFGQIGGTGTTFSNGIFTGSQVYVASYENTGKTTIVAGGTGGFINFATGGILTANERMRLTAAGRLLLGTVTEGTFLLDVNGTGRFTGALTVNTISSTSNTQLSLNAGFGAGTYSPWTHITILNGTAGWGYDTGGFWYGSSNSAKGYLYFRTASDELLIRNTIKNFFSGQTAFGTESLNSSAQLQIDSTTKGFLQPRLTTTQRDAIVSPATGLSLYNTTTNTTDFYNGTTWMSGGVNIYNSNGTLTGNRTVASGGFSLTLNPNTIFNFSGNAGIPEQTIPIIGASFAQTFNATASNVYAYGVDISPTFNITSGGYVIAAALRLGNSSGFAIYQTNSSVVSRFDGRIDVGSTAVSPIAKVEVLATSARGIRVMGSDPTNGGVVIGSSLGNTFALIAGITNQTQNGFTFRNLTTNSDLYTIHNNGNIIFGGTTDAGFKADIQGTLRTTGNVNIDRVRIETNGKFWYNNIWGERWAMILSGDGDMNFTCTKGSQSIIFRGESTFTHIIASSNITSSIFIGKFEGREGSILATQNAGNGNYTAGTARIGAGFTSGTTQSPTNVQGVPLYINPANGGGSGNKSDIIFQTVDNATYTPNQVHQLIDRWWVKGNSGTLSNAASPSSGFNIDVYGNSKFEKTYTYSSGTGTQAVYSLSNTTYGSGASISAGTAVSSFITVSNPTFNGSITIPNSVTFASQYIGHGITLNSTGMTVTMTQSTGIRALASQIQQMSFTDASTSGTVTHMAGTHILAPYKNSGNVVTISNYYGMLLNSSDEYSSQITVSNRWGIYQDGASDNNYFRGKVVIGSTNTVGASPLNVKDLPTSSAGLSTGDIWNNGGVLNIV